MSWIWDKRSTSCWQTRYVHLIFFELHQIHDVGGRKKLRAGQRVGRRRHRRSFRRVWRRFFCGEDATKKVGGFSKNPWTESLRFFHAPISWSFFTYIYMIYIYNILILNSHPLNVVHPTAGHFPPRQTGAGWRWHSAWWKNLILTRMASCLRFPRLQEVAPIFFQDFLEASTQTSYQVVGERGGRQYEIKLTCSNALILVFNDIIWIYAMMLIYIACKFYECFGSPCANNCALRRCKLCRIHEGLQPTADADGLCLLTRWVKYAQT